MDWYVWLLVICGAWFLFRRRKRKRDSTARTTVAFTQGRNNHRSRSYRTERNWPEDDFDGAIDFEISAYVGGRKLRTEPVTQSGDKHWVPDGQTATVAGQQIGGMIYVGQNLQAQLFEAPDNCLINPQLNVAKSNADIDGSLMSYWPSYSQIDAQSRLAYLQWLAGGRRDASFGVGYPFLFLYGLERRALLDQCSLEERNAITSELQRLKALYEANGSFQRYASELLEAIAVLDGKPKLSKTDGDRRHWELPFSVRWAIGSMISKGSPLGADWLLLWWLKHPESRVRMPAKRARIEFRRLFALRFTEQYPNGMRVGEPKARLKYVYRAASGSFEVDLSSKLGDVPDISNLSKPVRAVSAIAERCMEDLDSYSRYLGRNPDGKGTIEGHALLPEELARELPNRELDELKAWSANIIRDSDGLVLVEQLVERLEGRRPQKVSRKVLAVAADALARLGIGFAPDPRFALRAPRIGEPVVLFAAPEGAAKLQTPSSHYPGTLLSVMLGAFVAHADGDFSTAERQKLESEIDHAPGLNEAERVRLKANLKWTIAAAPKLGDLKRHLRDLPEHLRHTLALRSIATAGADGRIDPSEVDALKKLYKALGLNESNVFSDLHAITTQPAHEPITVRPAQASPAGYSLPSAPMPHSTPEAFTLDMERVGAILADTTKASAALHEIFGDEDDDYAQPDESVAAEEQVRNPASILEPNHRSLAHALAERRNWTPDEFEALAGNRGLLAGGAVETLNEWAFEIWDEPFLDEDGDLIVNASIAAELNTIKNLRGANEAA